jgi:hypothetical protein
MRKSQRGITLIGWMLLLIPIGIVGYAGIRVTPIYLNYFRVIKVLEQTASEGKGEATNPIEARASIERRFNVEYVDTPDAKDIDIHRDGDHWVAIAKYEEVAPLFGNLSLLVEFDKQVVLQ